MQGTLSYNTLSWTRLSRLSRGPRRQVQRRKLATTAVSFGAFATGSIATVASAPRGNLSSSR